MSIERFCKVCGKRIPAARLTPYALKKGWSNYCSHSCSNKGREISEETREKLRIAGAKADTKSPQAMRKWKAKMEGKVPWNKGLTKETDSRLEMREDAKSRRKGIPHPWVSRTMKGKPKPEDQREKIGLKTKARFRDPKWVKKFCKICKLKPNKVERKLYEVLQNLFPSEYALNVKADIITLGGRIPDFVNVNGQKKLIELYGDYWHQNEDPQNRINHFKQFGFDTLIVWEHELEDKARLVSKLKDFHQRRIECLR